MEKDFLDKHDFASANDSAYALQSVLALNLPKVIELNQDNFIHLGPKIQKEANRILAGLFEKHGENLPCLMAIALRESWFSCWEGAWYIALMIRSGGMGNNEYTKSFATAEGYAEREGWANAMVNNVFGKLSEAPEQATFREGTPFQERIAGGDLLQCMALYWFNLAADAQRSGNTDEAFNWIYEGFDALAAEATAHMWDEGSAFERENGSSDTLMKEARSAIAKNAASKKNANPRAWVQSEWEKRTDKGQSKASFARQYAPLVKREHSLLVTTETIARDWLPKAET